MSFSKQWQYRGFKSYNRKVHTVYLKQKNVLLTEDRDPSWVFWPADGVADLTGDDLTVLTSRHPKARGYPPLRSTLINCYFKCLCKTETEGRTVLPVELVACTNIFGSSRVWCFRIGVGGKIGTFWTIVEGFEMESGVVCVSGWVWAEKIGTFWTIVEGYEMESGVVFQDGCGRKKSGHFELLLRGTRWSRV